MTSPPRSEVRLLAIGERATELSEGMAAAATPPAELLPAADPEAAWALFRQFQPTHVLASLGGGGRDGSWFLRRLQSEYLGQMPQSYLLIDREQIPAAGSLEPDVFLLHPAAPSALAALLREASGADDSPLRRAARLRELFLVSLLGGALADELGRAAARATLAFRADECVFLGFGRGTNAGTREAASRTSAADDAASGADMGASDDPCRLALALATTLVVSSASGAKSYLAAPLGSPGEPSQLGLCLVSARPLRHGSDERDALRLFGRRLSGELSWISAHNRLLAEHEKGRRSAPLDPLLGILSRSALEAAIGARLRSSKGRKLALAVIDFVGLRTVNDHHGHRTGDAVLKHLSDILVAALGPADSVGRFGGDELAILFVGADLAAAKDALVGIHRLLKGAPYVAGELQIPLRIRSGLTALDSREMSGDAAFARAVSGVERARERGDALAVVDRTPVAGVELELGGEDALPRGSTLGGMYSILHEINRGAMGIVYRGEDLSLGRQVAIKVLRSDLASDQSLVERFRDEAALLASLRHRNLVQVHSFGSEGDNVYFVMELVEGEPLSKIIERAAGGRDFIDRQAVAKIVEEIADALEALHSVGIVHRDVKPDNVLIDRVGDRAVLVDVGIATRPDDARDAAGTPGFGAPECFMEVDETAATDVYGLAATTYAMLTNRPPYGSGELTEVVHAQLAGPPRGASHYQPTLPSAVDQVLCTAMAPEQLRRYRSASAFAIAVNRALRRAPGPPRPSPRISSGPPVGSGRPTTREEVTYRLEREPLPETAAAAAADQSRGAFFRAAALLLSQRLGAPWLDELSHAHPELRALLVPTLTVTAWHPTRHLAALLAALPGEGNQATELARQLGGAALSTTLARFFGADLRPQSPISLLRAAESYWGRYHSWGILEVAALAERTAQIEIRELGPFGADRLLRELCAGSLARIAELGSGSAVRAEIAPSPVPDVWRFALRWSSAGAA